MEAIQTLCRVMERGYELFEGRIARLEDHFRGNGDSLMTRIRLLASDVERLDDRFTRQLASDDERRSTALEHADELVRIQIAQLDQRREDALREATREMQRQLDTYSTELGRVKKGLEEARSRKWDVLKILLAWVLGGALTVLVQMLLKK